MASPSSSDRAGAAASDAFGLLGLRPRFDVEASVLERAFFDRTKELHPDRFATAPAAERVAALSKARALNDAYQLLKKEASRAEYLLAQEGVTIGDNERLDPALVMELLEQREELSLHRASGNLAEIERLCESMRRQRRAALDQVKTLFQAADDLSGDARRARIAEIKRQLILLRYVERYLAECDSALDED